MTTHGVVTETQEREGVKRTRTWHKARCTCGRWYGRWHRDEQAAASEHRRHRRRQEATEAARLRRRREVDPIGPRPVTPASEVDAIIARHAAERLVPRVFGST